ncbi:hypothetical protein RyT2_03870 [Pseudolactococcus yaeyamensis]
MLKKIMILKISLLTMVSLVSIFYNGYHPNMILGLIEIYAIFFLAQLFSRRLQIIAYLLSSIAYFFVLLNIGTFIASGNYISYIMYNNVTNISALGESLPKYISALILAATVSFMPMTFGLFRDKTISKVLVFYCIDLLYIIIFILLNLTTPIGSFIELKHEIKIADERVSFLKASRSEKKEILKEFTKDNIISGVETDVEKMNVILIFAEGISSRVLDVNNNLKLNLTPNLDSFLVEPGVTNVQNYFNHTAATFRGIRGQLYSAYQYQEGYEKGESGGLYSMTDTHLVSLPDVLRENGYVSNFINPEPTHVSFSNYLNTLGFDKVITGKKKDLVKVGSEKTLSDQKNYDLLFEKSEQLSNLGNPFLLTTYSFGTHVKLKGDEKYNDGKIDIYNRFYSMDLAFGSFWKKFKESSMYDNTVVVFTTDHTTYTDPDYMKNFNESYNPFLDKIPLLIYYPKNTQKTLNAGGKNSLSLAPTILDILGLENNKNYFLGNSLFTNITSSYQHVSEFGSDFYTTKNDKFTSFDDEEVIDKIMDFNKVSLNN